MKYFDFTILLEVVYHEDKFLSFPLKKIAYYYFLLLLTPTFLEWMLGLKGHGLCMVRLRLNASFPLSGKVFYLLTEIRPPETAHS